MNNLLRSEVVRSEVQKTIDFVKATNLEEFSYIKTNYPVKDWIWDENLSLHKVDQWEISAYVLDNDFECYYDGSDHGHNCPCPQEVALTVICANMKVPIPKKITPEERKEAIIACDFLESSGFGPQAKLFLDLIGEKL